MSDAVPRKMWYLLLPAAVLLAVVAWRAGGLVAAGSPAQLEGPVAPSSVSAPVALAELPPLTIAPLPERLDTGVAAGLPLDLRAGLEGEPDLFRYAQRLQAAAASGNAEASWMISRVYDYCSGYAMDPVGYARDAASLAQLRNGATFVAARDRVAGRCSGFVATDGLGRTLVTSQRIEAARAGNLAAEAALLAAGQPLQEDEAYRRDLAQRVLQSGDPEAYLALSWAMGLRARGDNAYRGMVAGDQYAELAWQLAACELGLACDNGSVLMNGYCANGGICSQDSRQDFASFVYDAAVSRQGAEEMKDMVDSLLSPEVRR